MANSLRTNEILPLRLLSHGISTNTLWYGTSGNSLRKRTDTYSIKFQSSHLTRAFIRNGPQCLLNAEVLSETSNLPLRLLSRGIEANTLRYGTSGSGLRRRTDPSLRHVLRVHILTRTLIRNGRLHTVHGERAERDITLVSRLFLDSRRADINNAGPNFGFDDPRRDIVDEIRRDGGGAHSGHEIGYGVPRFGVGTVGLYPRVEATVVL